MKRSFGYFLALSFAEIFTGRCDLFFLLRRSARRFNNKLIHNEDVCFNLKNKITTYCKRLSSSFHANTYIASTKGSNDILKIYQWLWLVYLHKRIVYSGPMITCLILKTSTRSPACKIKHRTPVCSLNQQTNASRWFLTPFERKYSLR